jgi:SAM-dependent methyltransferase
MDQDLLSDCIEWDVVNWSKALKFWEDNFELSNRNLLCLELGGRRGGLSLWLASKGNKVICSDIENPRIIAEPIHKKYSLNGEIEYQQIDAQSIPYKNHFDIIIFKSILGGISRGGDHVKVKVLKEIYSSLKTNGRLLFAENLSASKMHSFLRKKLRRWGPSWNYLQIKEIEQLFNKFDSLQYETAGFLGAFGRNEFQKKVLGRLDTSLFDRILRSVKIHSLRNCHKKIVFGTWISLNTQHRI